MRKAIFVVGPESSGTRMMVQFFMQCGYEGNAGHSQPWDDMRFREYPDRLVFRRSMPHGNKWPDLVGIIGKMQAANYTVYPIYTWRDPRYMALSQVNASHKPTEDEALDSIALSVVHVDTAFEELGMRPTTILYEHFINNESYRRAISGLFTSMGYTPFEVRDGNSKYVKWLDKISGAKLQKVIDATKRSKRLGL